METKVEKNSLKASEICSILRTCYETKVSVLKFAGLEVQFHGEELNSLGSIIKNLPDKAMSEVEQAVIQASLAENLEEQANNTKQMQLDQMLIEDPSQYEHLLLSGELEDAENRDQGIESALSGS